MVAGHWSPLSRQYPRCATHLAVMPLEPLTFVLVHLPLLPFQSLWTWRGDDPCTVISFVNTDTLRLVWRASQSEISWCGHRCALMNGKINNAEIAHAGNVKLLQYIEANWITKNNRIENWPALSSTFSFSFYGCSYISTNWSTLKLISTEFTYKEGYKQGDVKPMGFTFQQP